MVSLNGKKIALCVTVYMYRTITLVKNLCNIRKDLDIYIVTQSNDPNKEKYNEFVSDNIKIINTEATSIFEKREALRNKISELGYDAYIQIDDDILFACHKITPESKRPTSDTYHREDGTFNELLDKILETAFNYNAGLVSACSDFYIGFNHPGQIGINKSIQCGQFVYLDVNVLDKLNIHYDTSGLVHEDIDIVVKLMQNGIDCVTIKDYSYIQENTWLGRQVNQSSLYSDVETLYKFILNGYVKWHFPINTIGKEQNKLNMRIPFNKIWKTTKLPDADDTLLQLCKDGDVYEVMNYINNKKANKKIVKK